jgi:predicted phage terminase large subunit-like protein
MKLDAEQLQQALQVASPSEKTELLALVEELELREKREACQNDFLTFVKAMWPDFIEGAHHRRIAKLFNDVAEGKLKRLIISLPPRHTKSEFTSYLFPAWYMGKYPDRKAIQVSNTAELAEGFGRKVRNLMETSEYKAIFPDVEIRADSRAAGRWNTNHNGDYFACGVGAALAGRGANIGLLDDVHTEAEALAAIHNPGIYDKTTDWYTTGIRQRLQPGGALIICMTRWSMRDIIGQILEKMGKEKVDKWEYVEFPAILPSGNPLWPGFWSLEELEAIRAELPAGKWNAQYMQNPTSDETAIIKREYWQIWKEKEPPKVEYTLMSFDCAFEAKQSADYSAMTLWGVWENPEDNYNQHIILLDAWRDKLEFPELKAKALELYREHEPDSVIIEKKASGAPLIYELRKMGIPVQEFTPSKGNDKIVRLNAIADIFASKKVWAPDRRWAEDVVEEVASFPAGRHDDYVDTLSQALSRIRKGGMVRTQHDEEDDDVSFRYSRKAAYY